MKGEKEEFGGGTVAIHWNYHGTMFFKPESSKQARDEMTLTIAYKRSNPNKAAHVRTNRVLQKIANSIGFSYYTRLPLGAPVQTVCLL